jgi:hypothetical protein
MNCPLTGNFLTGKHEKGRGDWFGWPGPLVVRVAAGNRRLSVNGNARSFGRFMGRLRLWRPAKWKKDNCADAQAMSKDPLPEKGRR